ncbi:hypothetical protein FBZ88_104174 [Nitrospirillum bahiense]|uniref:Uncharacterized protein n=1 Tax=Nitrospirillum amazonense TaxID=28077 RepID=A0A560G549_9PROT|nr:hypothetical protein FBZ88_104174 [Nitrospirillum amazonense]
MLDRAAAESIVGAVPAPAWRQSTGAAICHPHLPLLEQPPETTSPGQEWLSVT